LAFRRPAAALDWARNARHSRNSRNSSSVASPSPEDIRTGAGAGKGAGADAGKRAGEAAGAGAGKGAGVGAGKRAGAATERGAGPEGGGGGGRGEPFEVKIKFTWAPPPETTSEGMEKACRLPWGWPPLRLPGLFPPRPRPIAQHSPRWRLLQVGQAGRHSPTWLLAHWGHRGGLSRRGGSPSPERLSPAELNHHISIDEASLHERG
jgi:hypothetical protein